MFIDHIKQTFVRAISAVKNLSLSIKNKFLEIKSNCFGNAKIFCILRNSYFHFIAYSEEMVYRITAGEYYCSESGNEDFPETCALTQVASTG